MGWIDLYVKRYKLYSFRYQICTKERISDKCIFMLVFYAILLTSSDLILRAKLFTKLLIIVITK
jgi:hypothetical protein